MRICYNDAQVKEGYRLGSAEAKSFFGDDRLLVEKYVEDPLAEQIVKSNLKEGDSIKIDMQKDATELTVDIKKGTKALPAKDKEK